MSYPDIFFFIKFYDWPRNIFLDLKDFLLFLENSTVFNVRSLAEKSRSF